MRRDGLRTGALTAALLSVALALPDDGAAAVRCEEPGLGDWEEATPEEAGMDGERLREAIELGSRNISFAIRVYRYGCRVGADSRAALNHDDVYQSWSVAKSVTGLVFGRAMRLGLIGPDDPLGSLLPEADRSHGEIAIRDLLTMTSGLHWNGFRDYNIFMPDRIREALTVPVEKRPGSYWEYSQSGVALLAEAVERAAGEDFQVFAQRELFGPLGIPPGRWRWERDSAGNTQGFWGLLMRPDDYGRLGELLRRGGTWRDRRLLPRRFVTQATAPVRHNGCYGWLIWVNAAQPCVGPRIEERPVADRRLFPGLPDDMYKFAGLFGQLVTVFPSHELVVVRSGLSATDLSGGSDWEARMYRAILDSIRDEEVRAPRRRSDASRVSRDDVDRGFYESFGEPNEYMQGHSPPPLPPAGPARARAVALLSLSRRPDRRGSVAARLRCPPRWPAGVPSRCRGRARLTGARAPVAYRIAAGRPGAISFRLRAGFLRRLEREGRERVTLTARNRGRLGGTTASRALRLQAR